MLSGILFSIFKVATLCGSEKGFKDGALENALFSGPRGILFDPSSNSLFVCDVNNAIVRQIDLEGTFSFRFCCLPLILLNNSKYCQRFFKGAIQVSLHCQVPQRKYIFCEQFS